MDVAGTGFYCLGEHQIDQFDDGRIACVIQEISRLFNLGNNQVRVLLMHLLDDLFSGITAHVIGKIDGGKNGRMRGKHHIDAVQA